jgi:hypothetical protein
MEAIMHRSSAPAARPVLAPGSAGEPTALGAVALAVGLQLLAAFLTPLAEVLQVAPMTGEPDAPVGSFREAVIGQAIEWAAAGPSRAR